VRSVTPASAAMSAVVNGMVYAGSAGDGIYAFGLAAGAAAVKPPTAGQLHRSHALTPQHGR
jgi:hypothetical protein